MKRTVSPSPPKMPSSRPMVAASSPCRRARAHWIDRWAITKVIKISRERWLRLAGVKKKVGMWRYFRHKREGQHRARKVSDGVMVGVSQAKGRLCCQKRREWLRTADGGEARGADTYLPHTSHDLPGE